MLENFHEIIQTLFTFQKVSKILLSDALAVAILSKKRRKNRSVFLVFLKTLVLTNQCAMRVLDLAWKNLELARQKMARNQLHQMVYYYFVN